MEYNNYYPSQACHPPPPNQQIGGGGGGNSGGPQMTQQQQQQHQNYQMMHSPMHQQNTRQQIPPGPPNHHQQIQQQQHLQHQGYQQIHSPHGPPVPHSNSPHAQQHHQTQHQHHNHQPNMTGPLPQQAMGSHHLHHSQSPHHIGPMPPHVQPQQPLNHMARPQMGPAVINHHHPGMNQPPVHPQQNFFGGGPIPQANLHYHQQNQHHHPQNQSTHHHHIHHQHQAPMMHHGPPPPMVNHFPHHIQPGLGRSSPYLLNILQSEFRLIEFNRRLQCRPVRYPSNPMPSLLDEHSLWWDRFASEFFEDDATLTLRLTLEEKPVEYTIGRTLIPRFFRTYFDGGVTDLSINLRNPKETFIHPHTITLDCDQAFVVTNNTFKLTGMSNNHGIVVYTEGHLNIDFVSNNFDPLSIKSWRFYTKRSHEYIDRNILATLGLPNNYLAEPITRQGLTQSTISYLKMCMIMEPMQELMFQHKQTKMDPKSCLRKLLFDRYKFRSCEDNRPVTNKRRKRKPSGAPATGVVAASNKKTKATLSNNSGLNNNMMASPSAVQPLFSLATQDVMVVGEPSMMGGDFGDDNERMITRLENTQYDPGAIAQGLNNDHDNQIMNPSSSNDAVIEVNRQIQPNQNHVMSPSIIDQNISSKQSHQNPAAQNNAFSEPVTNSLEQQSQQVQHSLSSQAIDDQHEKQQLQASVVPLEVQEETVSAVLQSPSQANQQQQSISLQLQSEQDTQNQTGHLNDNASSDSSTIIQPSQENHNNLQLDEANKPDNQSSNLESIKLETIEHPADPNDFSGDDARSNVDTNLKQLATDHEQNATSIVENNFHHDTDIKNVKANLLTEDHETQILMSMDSMDPIENHTNNSIQNLTDESNSNSQLACSTADNRSTATTTME